MKPSRACAVGLVFGVVLSGQTTFAETRDAAAWTAHLASEYDITFNVTYLVAGNVDLKLDIYAPRGLSTPNAVVVYYHGGFAREQNERSYAAIRAFVGTLGLLPARGH